MNAQGRGRQPNEKTDRVNLQRFIGAQQAVYSTVLSELRSGRKTSHWIWFVFPQVAGLGRSSLAQRFSIRSLDEAIAYLATPVLGARLIECTKLVLAVPDKSARDIFRSPDDAKFRSSMTLFDAADGGNLHKRAIDRFFGEKPDQATLNILDQWNAARALGEVT